jgi:hypothetical protein
MLAGMLRRKNIMVNRWKRRRRVDTEEEGDGV